jgi:hypothetical protein
VQGYFVEPLLAVAAARRGCVLLPAAAVEVDGRALLLLGRSGTGKSTLTARAAATGTRILGDDHVLLDAAGRCWPFPRRMRLYPDLKSTGPRAYEGLGRGHRLALAGRRHLRTLTLGYVAPPLAVEPHRLGASQASEPLGLGRVVVIERGARGANGLRADSLDAESAVAAAMEVLEAQRSRLDSAGDGGGAELERTRGLECSHLEEAFRERRVERLAVPDGWRADRAVAALSDRLGCA